MKFKGFYWFIKYYVPKENQIKYYKKNKKYKDSLEKSAHLLELICSNYDDHKKLNVSLDLVLTDNHTVKFPHGKTIESIILASKLLRALKEINFKLGLLQKGLPDFGWLKPRFSQDKYLLDKLDQWSWYTETLQIKTLFNKKLRSDLESLQLKTSFVDLYENNLDLSVYKKGKIVVSYWATWCAPCIKEMPSIKSAEKILEDYDYTFLLVSDETVDKISKFKNEFNFDLNFLKSNKSFETLGIFAMPTSYIFDENGQLIETIVGAIQWDSEEMINKLKML